MYDSTDTTHKHKSGAGNWKPLGSFNFKDTGEMKAAHFELNDAKFSGRCNGYDMRLQLISGSRKIIQGIYVKETTQAEFIENYPKS